MKAPFYAIVSFFLLIGLSLSCGSSSTEPGKGTIVSFPMEQGNRWVYERYYYEILAGDNSVSDTAITLVVRRVTGVDTAQSTLGLTIIDDSLTVFNMSDTGNTTIERSWWRNTNGKIFEIANGFGVDGEPISPVFWDNPPLLLDYPLMNGKSWVLGLNNYGSIIRRIIDFDDYQFEGRTYNCAIIKTTINGIFQTITTEWYSQAGMIQSHTISGPIYIHDGIGNIVDSLYSYVDHYLRDIEIAN